MFSLLFIHQPTDPFPQILKLYQQTQWYHGNPLQPIATHGVDQLPKAKKSQSHDTYHLWHEVKRERGARKVGRDIKYHLKMADFGLLMNSCTSYLLSSCSKRIFFFFSQDEESDATTIRGFIAIIYQKGGFGVADENALSKVL